MELEKWLDKKRQTQHVSIRRDLKIQEMSQKIQKNVEIWVTTSFKQWYQQQNKDLLVLNDLISDTQQKVLKQYYQIFLKVITPCLYQSQGLSLLAKYEQRIQQTQESLFCQIIEHFSSSNSTPNVATSNAFLNYITIGINNLFIDPYHHLMKYLLKCDDLFINWWNQSIQLDLKIVSSYALDALSLQRSKIIQILDCLVYVLIQQQPLSDTTLLLIHQIFMQQKYNLITQKILSTFQVIKSLINSITINTPIVLKIFKKQCILQRLINQRQLPTVLNQLEILFDKGFSQQNRIISWIQQCCCISQKFSLILIKNQILFQRILNQCSSRTSDCLLSILWHSEFQALELLINKHHVLELILERVDQNRKLFNDTCTFFKNLYVTSIKQPQYRKFIQVGMLEKLKSIGQDSKWKDLNLNVIDSVLKSFENDV